MQSSFASSDLIRGTSGPVGGRWVWVEGGMRLYCALGQHFTTGPAWQYVVGIVAHSTVCAECAGKEVAP